MARISRAEVIDPNEVTVVHAINRTVRRCFLLGNDPISGKNFDHRKVWIEELLQHFAGCFAIDLLAYSLLSNHYHLILRTRPDIVAAWDDTEVARRWLLICPPHQCKERSCKEKTSAPTEADLNTIRNCPIKLAEARERLSSVSWWMRLLNQRIAQRANREDGEFGKFWQERFRAIRLMDEESVLACAAYVELNPIRAALAESIEDSDFTSIQRRIDAEKESSFVAHNASDCDANELTDRPAEETASNSSTLERRDAFLAKLTLAHPNNVTNPIASETGRRCSDQGFFEMEFPAYLELLDWTARQIAPNNRGGTPAETPPVLQRLGLQKSAWCELVMDFEQSFIHVAGRCDRIAAARSHCTGRRFRIPSRTQALIPAPN